jgi:hypothetical protein
MEKPFAKAKKPPYSIIPTESQKKPGHPGFFGAGAGGFIGLTLPERKRYNRPGCHGWQRPAFLLRIRSR